MRKLIGLSTIAVVASCLITNLASGQREVTSKQDPEVSQILQVEEEFRLAKLNNDTSVLHRILADDFYETNQNGNTRDKAQMIELFETFKILGLTTTESYVRISGNVASVRGYQMENHQGGQDRMLFSRVYRLERQGWRLFSSTQFNDPKIGDPKIGLSQR